MLNFWNSKILGIVVLDLDALSLQERNQYLQLLLKW